MDFVPSGIHVYNEFSENKILDNESGKMIYPLNCIISSFTHHLMVYNEFNLIWAAKFAILFHIKYLKDQILFLMV